MSRLASSCSFTLKTPDIGSFWHPTGNKGMELLTSNPMDLVIVDIFMPQKDGIETIIELQGKDSNCGILAISGGSEIGGTEYLDYAKTLGAHETLAKPFAKNDLLEAVSRFF